MNFGPYSNEKSHPFHQLRPKYAFLAPSEKTRLPTDYGNVYFVLKHRVKDRSTFTVGDSLNNRSQNRTNNRAFSFDYPTLLDLEDREYYETQIYGDLNIGDVYEVVPELIQGLKK